MGTQTQLRGRQKMHKNKSKMKDNPAKKLSFDIKKLEGKKNPDGAECFAPIQNQYRKLNKIREELKKISRRKR